MLCLVAIFLLAFFAQTNTQSTTSKPWGKYTGKDEEFSVQMPHKPSLYFDLITDRSGSKTPGRIYSAYSNGAVYLVVSYDRSSLKDTFENFKLHNCREAKITSIKEKMLTGFAGKEYSLKFGDVVGVLDIYATKKHGYAVATVQAVDNAPLRDYFMSTFSLSGTTDSTASPPEVKNLVLSEWPHIATNEKEVTKPVVVSKPAPSYSDEARKAGITGTVVLRVIFWSSGEVGNIVVVRGLSNGLTEQAVEAARHLTFIPATRDGAFVSHWMELQYNFGLY